MNLPSDTPKLPKLIFLAGDAILLVTAWFIWTDAKTPTVGMPLVAVVVCVGLACALGVIPFMTEYARRQDEALDNRQRSLQALAATIAGASEQVAIAATGLQGISEAAQENLDKSEKVAEDIKAQMAELRTLLAAAKRDDGEAAVRLEAVAKKVAKAAADFEAVAAKAAETAARASEAARAAPVRAPVVVPEPPPVPPVKMVEIRPAVAASSMPFDFPAPAPLPLAAPLPVAPTPKVATPPVEPFSGPAPAAEAPAPAEPATIRPAEEVAAAAPAPRRRAPRKPAPLPEAPAPEAASGPAAAEPSPAPPEIAEPAISADGATRLVVTAYIGIGNRLFIRGEGPGLSWGKGVPLTFVSIGKWRWETNDAAGAVRFKLYKNDEVECTALGTRTVEPGAQQDLTASF
jgi:hypothetical protein